MNVFLEVLSNEINKIKKALTQTGSDYTATVTKVEGDTAYVQMTGSDISDTPVSMSVNAAKGDHVRVRVANGKAWITGNDSSPPTDDTKAEQAIQETRAINERINNTEEAADGRYSKIEQTVDQITLEVGVAESKADAAQTTANGRMKADMSNKASSITIGSGQIAFNSNTLVVNSSKFTLDADGNSTFSGSLSAASGTFSGNLSAAGGTFKGSVIFPWSSSVTRNIYINDTSKGAPIVIQGVGEGGLGALETSIMSGYIEVSQAYQDKSAMLSPTGVQTFSDARLKKDVKAINPEIAKRLRPVQFRFKKSEDIEYGFIAQDVQEVIPAAVSKGLDNDYLMLNYQELIAPLYALVQEQEDRINQLEARLKALEDKK